MDRQVREHNEMLTSTDKTYHYTPTTTAAVQLTVKQQIVRITNNFAFALSLPPVSEAAGLTFAISTVNATAAVTLTDFGGASLHDSINWEGNYTLDAAEDQILLKSDGRTWHVIENAIA